MMDKKLAIVVVGYNRPKGMLRLLDSLESAAYSDEVTLIVSVDNSGSDAVADAADAFAWTHGEKRVIRRPGRMGLKKHILSCGDFLNEFDAIALLEDDLIVAEGFFDYMKATVEKYAENDAVAGISLFAYPVNEHCGYPFCPSLSPYDAYFIRTSQSWGQIWMKKQWFDFVRWLSDNDTEEIAESPYYPADLCHWPKSSWKKYHIIYCATQNKYMVFPYASLTTCYSDVGEHRNESSDVLQVPILHGRQENYRLPDTDKDDAVFYDTFFERVIPGKIGCEGADICFDLYGGRTVYPTRYVLSTKRLDYKICDKYALTLRPQEENYLSGVKGEDAFLYDTSVAEKNDMPEKNPIVYRYKLYGNFREVTKWGWRNLRKQALMRITGKEKKK